MEVCSLCQTECVIELTPDDFDESTASAAGGSTSTVPDDLQLQCGCHFHWQCLFDEASEIIETRACPAVKHPIISSKTSASGRDTNHIITRYLNEGGLQELDILPLINEELYLDSNPSARPARAFMTLCGEGDLVGMVELLRAQGRSGDDDEDADDAMSPAQILRYQDPLDGMRSSLQVAVEKEKEEVVWLLLWLASGLESAAFPQKFLQAVHNLGVNRELASQGVDLRSLKDEEGKTVQDIFLAAGTWESFVQSGNLIINAKSA